MSNTYVVLNLGQVRCFVETVDAGTMTAAADRLRVTQSAVSLAITKLEHSVGTQLLTRSRSTGLGLTQAGRDLLPLARDLLLHAEEVRDAAAAAGSGLRGRLCVGCFRTTAPFVLPKLLEGFAQAYPGVGLEFIEGPGPVMENALIDGRCEVAILQDLDLRPAIEHVPLHTLRPHVIVSEAHGLAGVGRVSLAELAKLDLVLLDVAPSAVYFRGLFTAAGLEPRVRHVAASYEIVRSLVGRNLGYGLLGSRPATAATYEGRTLVEVEIIDDVEPIRFCLAWRRGTRRTRKAAAFIELCQSILVL